MCRFFISTKPTQSKISSVKDYNLSTTSWSPNGLISEKTYVYGNSDWKDKLTSYNGTTIDYDANGNPLNYRDGMIFEWITGRSLDTITKGNTEIIMKYDCNGMRTQKEIGDDVTNYYYDSGNNLIGLTYGNNTLFFYYDNNGTPTSFAHNGTMYYYVKNLLGDIVQITKQDGTVVAKYVYDVWGKILSIKDGSNNTIETTNATHLANLNPFRYRGYVYDNETGLYYLQSRYYDPITGRFLNADVYCDTQTGSPLSTNIFAYCENNAIKFIDANGCKTTTISSSPSLPQNEKKFIIDAITNSKLDKKHASVKTSYYYSGCYNSDGYQVYKFTHTYRNGYYDLSEYYIKKKTYGEWMNYIKNSWGTYKSAMELVSLVGEYIAYCDACPGYVRVAGGVAFIVSSLKSVPSEEKYILNQISIMKDKYKVESSKFKFYICMRVRNRRYSYTYNSRKKTYSTSCFENNTYRPY